MFLIIGVILVFILEVNMHFSSRRFIQESAQYFHILMEDDYKFLLNVRYGKEINNEGSKDAGLALENMSQDIDMLVENVYRDRIDRATFHKKFLQFGIVLYLMVMLVQFLLTTETYISMLEEWWVRLLLHLIVVINTYFLLSGEKYYNEDVGAE